ncbi:MAG: NfeD family protein [Chromatiales bacterium]|nr:NfeD family protein [Chromatiales bacterium]
MVHGLKRYSLPWWLIMAGMTGSLGTASAFTLWWFELLLNWQAVLLALFVIIAGDLLAALGLAMIAPTRVNLHPGERREPVGEVESGFGGQSHGRIRVHGERWRARLRDGSLSLHPGQRVRVTGREGLELLVSPVEERTTR